MLTLSNSSETNRLLGQAKEPDSQALSDLFARHRERLRFMVRLRLDRRLRRQFPSSSVLNGVYAEACRRLSEYTANPSLSFFLWLRLLAGQKLQALHRQHLEPQAWEAGPEVSLFRGHVPPAHSGSLAAQLLGGLAAAGQGGAARADVENRLQNAFNSMEPMDREVLALRHFEELDNDEAAAVLGIDPAAASNHYLRALQRMKGILKSIPGLLDNLPR